MKKIVFAFVLLILIFIIIFSTANKQVFSNLIAQKEKTSPESNNPEKNEISDETNSEENENSEEGSDSSDVRESPPSNPCEKQISYSLKNFNTAEECLSQENEICLIKRVTCSLEIKNSDSSLTGNFPIIFDFLDEEKNLLFTAASSISIEPKTTKIFPMTNQFEGENADKKFKCSFRTETPPTANVC